MDRKRLLTVRFTEEEYADLQEIARLAGRPLSRLVRDSLKRVKTWSALDRAAFRERTLAHARIGAALGDMARTLRHNPGSAPVLLPEIEEFQQFLKDLDEP
ncbi:MAG: plasmid mobilization protein [Leptospirales bacterium]